MAYIGIKPAESFTSFATQTFSTSATSSYTLDHAVTNENELALFINNVRQQPGSGKAYTATGTALTLSANTASTDTMYAIFLGRALQTVNPADGSVATASIAATAVTGAKLNTDVISAQTALAAEPADTDEFLVSDAGVLKRIDYSLIKGGGAYELLQTQTVSSAVAQVDFTSTYLTTAYRDYRIIISNTTPANDNVDFQMRFSADGGSSFHDGGDHGFANGGLRSTENSMLIDTLEDQSSFKLNCVQYLGSDTGETSDWIIDFFDPLNQQTDNQYLQYYVRGTWMDGGPASNSMFGSGTRKHTSYANAVVNGIRFFMSAGNIEAGNYSLYGRTI